MTDRSTAINDKTLPKVLWIAPAVILIVAVFPLPYGYYTFTRIWLLHIHPDHYVLSVRSPSLLGLSK